MPARCTFLLNEIMPNGTVALMLACSTPGKRGESCTQVPIKFLRAFRFVAGKARICFEQKTRARFQSGINRRRFARAANEQRRRCQQRERERDLNRQRADGAAKISSDA